MATFQQESLEQAWPDAQRLFALHYEELTFGKERVKLAPDTGRYKALERDGGLMVFTARDDDGAMAGYAVFFLTSHIHYRLNLFAVNDVFYIDPERRSDPWLGFRFIKFLDRHLSAISEIDAIKWHTKVHREFGPILHRLGYVPEETIWAKVNKG